MGHFNDLITTLRTAHAHIQSTHPTLATATTQLNQAHTLFHTTSHGSHHPKATQTTQALNKAQEELVKAHSLLKQSESQIQQYLTHLAGQTPETTNQNIRNPETDASVKISSDQSEPDSSPVDLNSKNHAVTQRSGQTQNGEDDALSASDKPGPMTQLPLGVDQSDPLIEHYKLPPGVNERIFRDDIVPSELAHASPRERPEAVFLVGQPGAGKTRLGEQLARGLDERGGFVDVDSDRYKPYHPDYQSIMDEDDQKMAVYTRHDGRVWMAKVQDYVRELKLNAIIQETVQNPEDFVQTVQAYRAAGFTVRVAVMGVPEGLSRQGILARYYEQIAESGHGRLTVPENAALSYRGIFDGAQRIDELHLADEVEVYRRGELEPRYRDELTGDGTWHSGTGGLRAALERERSRPLTPDEIGQFRDSQQRLREVAGVEHQDELSKIDNLLEPLIQPGEKPQ